MCKISPACLLTLVSLCLSACAQQGYTVIAASNTTIGVGISQSPTNGSIDATLGYKRQELAFVPTNRLTKEDQAAAGGEHAQGAKDTGNIIMEIRHSGIFSMGENSGIYQRLAVGDVAVQEAGASLMFAKGHDGTLDAKIQQAILNLASVQTESGESVRVRNDFISRYKGCKAAGDAVCVSRMDGVMRRISVGSVDELPIKSLTKEQVEVLKGGI